MYFSFVFVGFIGFLGGEFLVIGLSRRNTSYLVHAIEWCRGSYNGLGLARILFLLFGGSTMCTCTTIKDSVSFHSISVPFPFFL